MHSRDESTGGRLVILSGEVVVEGLNCRVMGC